MREQNYPMFAFHLFDDWKKKVAEVDAVVIATKWPEYTTLKNNALAGAIKPNVIVDPRRMFRPQDFQHVTYLTIARRVL
jgi:UDP-glucose 6-dehydrogenase